LTGAFNKSWKNTGFIGLTPWLLVIVVMVKLHHYL